MPSTAQPQPHNTDYLYAESVSAIHLLVLVSELYLKNVQDRRRPAASPWEQPDTSLVFGSYTRMGPWKEIHSRTLYRPRTVRRPTEHLTKVHVGWIPDIHQPSRQSEP